VPPLAAECSKRTPKSGIASVLAILRRATWDPLTSPPCSARSSSHAIGSLRIMPVMPRRSERRGGVWPEGGAPAAAADAPGLAPEAQRVDGIKAQLATLLACDAELDVELRELHAAVERVESKRKAVRAEISATKGDLDVAWSTRQ
jgi:outer membrane murein-binding lipoprotein Lpp